MPKKHTNSVRPPVVTVYSRQVKYSCPDPKALKPHEMSYVELKESGFEIDAKGDFDKDGVPNAKDCRPLDPNKHWVGIAARAIGGAAVGGAKTVGKGWKMQGKAMKATAGFAGRGIKGTASLAGRGAIGAVKGTGRGAIGAARRTGRGFKGAVRSGYSGPGSVDEQGRYMKSAMRGQSYEASRFTGDRQEESFSSRGARITGSRDRQYDPARELLESRGVRTK
tara:strand:- start:2662 stop:3330 length:669 start_codon:yes stop_codon:yes gene_type:complete